MPPPRRFLPAAKTEFTERTIHNCGSDEELSSLLGRLKLQTYESGS
jgi:hypothetical protein